MNGVHKRIRRMAGGASVRQRIAGDETREASRDQTISYATLKA